MAQTPDHMIEQSLENFSAITWRRFKKHKLALISLIILAMLSLLSIFAPLIESLLHVSHKIANINEANLPASFTHLFGTNELGQDVFTRIIFGGRISLSVGFISALFSALIGTTLGLLSGYFGGIVDAILMRFTDAMLSVPVLPLMIVFAALDIKMLFGPHSFIFFAFLLLFILTLFMLSRFISDPKSVQKTKGYFTRLIIDLFFIALFCVLIYVIFTKFNVFVDIDSSNFASVIKLSIIIIFFGWMSVARLARASAMQLKNMDFVLAANALGASHKRILITHIFPNALAPIIVTATLEVGSNILYEAALSFLGLGIQPPISSWGNMLNNAVDYVKTDPSLAFWPGLFILLTVSSFNFLGDGLRDALDPHQLIKPISK